MNDEWETIGNSDLRLQVDNDGGFNHVVLRDADDGDVIVVNEDDVGALRDRLTKILGGKTVSYFLLVPGEDGMRVEVLDKAELEKRLVEGYYGSRKVVGQVPERDHNYWGNAMVIIKGDLVLPKTVETVTKVELP